MNKISRTTKVIKAIPKCDSVKSYGIMWCTKNEEQGNWRGLSDNGKWYYVFSSHLRNSEIYEIECFESWDEAYEKGALCTA